MVDRDVLASLAALRLRSPDFVESKVEAERQMAQLTRPNGSVPNVQNFIEGMYLVAKYASFSPTAKLPFNAAGALVQERDFHRLPIPTRMLFLRAVAPELKTVKDSDMEALLNALSAKILPPEE